MLKDFEPYRREMDRIGADEEQADRILAALRTRNRRLPLRRGCKVLLAAAICAAMTLTALAVSPDLRAQLAQVLGGYAPYAQSVEGAVCTENGVEIRVISAMADSSMVKIYAEARDISGQNRLSVDMKVSSVINRAKPQSPAETRSFVIGGRCVGYDPSTGTALLECGAWGTGTQDLNGMRLSILGLEPDGDESLRETRWDLDLEVERLAERKIALDTALAGVTIKELRLSALGPTFRTEGEATLSRIPLTVWLADGTVVHPAYRGGGVSGIENPCRLSCWEYEDPVEPEQVAGISVGYWYIPLDGDTAGTGHWLDKLPD